MQKPFCRAYRVVDSEADVREVTFYESVHGELIAVRANYPVLAEGLDAADVHCNLLFEFPKPFDDTVLVLGCIYYL